MSLVTKYSESPVKLMENQKLVEIEFPASATEIIGLKTDNLTKIDVTKCSKDFVITVKSSFQNKTNNKGENVQVINPNMVIEYTASEKLTVSFTSSNFGANAVSHIFEDGKGVVTFDKDVTSIGAGAFFGCSGLETVTIPDSVTEIGDGAFSGCSGLTSITIPDSVTSIGGAAFNGCSKLTSINIPNSVKSIGLRAFYGCSELTSITIPDSVTSIGERAFADCM